jgi:hypothetical protein
MRNAKKRRFGMAREPSLERKKKGRTQAALKIQS